MPLESTRPWEINTCAISCNITPNNPASHYLGPIMFHLTNRQSGGRSIICGLHIPIYIPSPLTYSQTYSHTHAHIAGILHAHTHTHAHTHALCTHEAKHRNVYDFLKSNITWVVPLSDKLCWPIIAGHSLGRAGANVGLVPRSAMPLTSPDPASQGQKGIPIWAHVPGTQLWYQIQNNNGTE